MRKEHEISTDSIKDELQAIKQRLSQVEQGKTSPCIFRNSGTNVTAVAHGDDFTLLGPERELKQFVNQIKQKFEIKLGFNKSSPVTVQYVQK